MLNFFFIHKQSKITPIEIILLALGMLNEKKFYQNVTKQRKKKISNFSMLQFKA